MRNKFFTKQEETTILEAISKAEYRTTGEIKVHVEESSRGPILDRAAKIFSRLRLHKRKDRNAVLIYIAFKDHSFAIMGDKGINAHVNQDYWDMLRNLIQENFKKGDFSKGICFAIETLGADLKQHFPDHETCEIISQPGKADWLKDASA